MALMFSHLLCWLWWKLTLTPHATCHMPLAPCPIPRTFCPPLRNRQINWKLTVVTKRRIFPWHLCGSLCLSLNPYPESIYIWWAFSIECVLVCVMHISVLDFSPLRVARVSGIGYRLLYIYSIVWRGPCCRFGWVSASVFGIWFCFWFCSSRFRLCINETHARQPSQQNVRGLIYPGQLRHCVFGHNQSIAPSPSPYSHIPI